MNWNAKATATITPTLISAGLDDAAELLDRPLHGSRQVQPVQREGDRPHGEGEARQHQVGALQDESVVRSHEGLPGEGEADSQRHDQRIDGHQPLLQRRWRDEMSENHRFRGAQIYICRRQTARHAARLFNYPPVSIEQGIRAVAQLQFTGEKSPVSGAFRFGDGWDDAREVSSRASGGGRARGGRRARRRHRSRRRGPAPPPVTVRSRAR